MRKLSWLVLILALAVGIGMLIRDYPGMLVVNVAGWRLDLPLWLGVMGVVGILLLLQWISGGLQALKKSLLWLKHWTFGYKKQKARRATSKGLLALAEGKWAVAETALIQGAPYSEIPWMNYLWAAKAAHASGKEKLCDDYLEHAEKTTPQARVAIGLSRAQWAYDQDDYAQSLQCLVALEPQAPEHPLLLTLLQAVSLKQHDWKRLLVLLPRLKKHRIVPDLSLQRIEKTAWAGILTEAGREADGSQSLLEDLWQKMPKSLHFEPEIALLYAQAFADTKPEAVASVIRAALKHHWDEKLVMFYGTLSHLAPVKTLTAAESWLATHPNSPGLLLCLARLCEQQQLWGKAQRYFEASLSLNPQPHTYAELGLLLEKINKPELGVTYYKKGLMLASAIEGVT